MAAGRDELWFGRSHAPDRATFDLERFAWDSPDRLQLAGRFAGLSEALSGDPVLVVSGGTRTYRLPAVDTTSRPPASDQPWQATFAWQEAPTAFETARLELGEDVVELPAPRARRMPHTHKILPVQRGLPRNVPDADEAARGEAGNPDPQQEEGMEGTPAAEFKAEVELLVVREQMRELESASRELEEELGRVRDELATERERRGEDRRRFEEALADIQARAERVLLLEQDAAQTETAALRERVVALEDGAQAAEQVRAQLTEAQDAAAGARSEAEQARAAEREAVERVESLQARLHRIQAALTEEDGEPPR